MALCIKRVLSISYIFRQFSFHETDKNIFFQTSDILWIKILLDLQTIFSYETDQEIFFVSKPQT